MDTPQRLLTRLDEIGASLERTPRTLALIGLGSVGESLSRLDAYSDLDFFVIVEPGATPAFLERLDWLAAVRPIVYQFRNTVDGYKLLFDDDIFCEFAIFDPQALATVPYAPGRIVWKRPAVSEEIRRPALPSRPPAPRDASWLVGEALTNLYVGMGRYLRGEKLSAFQFVQEYAVDRVVELTALVEAEQPADADRFAAARRYERRFPQTSRLLASFMQGYERTPESAEALLAFLEAHFEINAAMARRVRGLCRQAREASDGGNPA